MQETSIEWVRRRFGDGTLDRGYTSNPLRYRDKDGNVVHACVHASTGCLHCYAETMAGRWGRAGNKFTAPNMEGLTPFLDEKELHSILTYKPASGKMCFLGDMTDIFGEWVPDELLDQLFAVLALRHDVTFQVLTKRAERMQQYFGPSEELGGITRDALVEGQAQKRYYDRTGEDPSMWLAVHWPLPNVWLGVSAENQQYWDERLDFLGRTPAAVRFVSYEPALGPIDPGNAFDDPPEGSEYGKIDWVIVGGESGPGSRPFDVRWAHHVIAQCKAAGVACFVKQLGAHPYAKHQNPNCTAMDDDIITWFKLKHRKGGDPSEWHPDLHVREFPET